MDHVVNNLFLLEHSNMKNPYVSRPLERRTKTSHENSLRTIYFKNDGQNESIRLQSKIGDSCIQQRMWFTFPWSMIFNIKETK